MSSRGLQLFELLPALYRLRDGQLAQSRTLLTPSEAARLRQLQLLTPPLPPDGQAELESLVAKASRGPLESLLLLVQEQLGVVAENLEQLYDDQFIETCAPWVIPYIGDLIGYQGVNGIAPAVASPRVEVAHTISFRRRKGTVLVMEQLARDVTGWGAHAAEFFRILGTTQYMNHVRLPNCYAPDVRRWQTGIYMDSGFDQTAHRVDVRRISVCRGRYNIQNIGIFLWSLNAYSVTEAPAAAVAADARCFRFCSLGCDIALFNNPVGQGSDIIEPAGPINVPDRLRRRVLCQDLSEGAAAVYYGESKSIAIYLDDKLLNPYQVQVCNLSGPDGSWINLPGTGTPFAAAIDPELGRIALPPPTAGSGVPSVRVTYYHGFSADMAGGEYPRQAGFVVQNEERVLPFPDTANPPRYNTLQDALSYATGQLAAQGEVAIQITNSVTYPEPGSPALKLAVNLPAGTTLELRAADGARPTLLLSGELLVTGAASSAFLMNGLIVASAAAPGSPSAALVRAPALGSDGRPSQLSRLQIDHCTLVPGWSLISTGTPQYGSQPDLVTEAAGLKVAVRKSILGGVRAAELVAVNISGSIVDSTDRTRPAYAAVDGSSAGGTLTMVGCTVVGKVHATLLSLVSNSIIWAQLAAGDTWSAPLIADRKQAGCVRFSYLPEGSVTPRRFECVEQGRGAPQPLFYSLRFGDPGYAKIRPDTGDAVRRGADDGGEMGAFHFVLAPLRETDLRVRMQEYLPVGLEFGIIYEN